MQVALLTLGTRVDVQSFAVLGQALAQRGHEVTLASTRNFAPLASQFGLHFRPINADYKKIATSAEGEKLLNANLLAIGRNINGLVFPLIEEALDIFFRLAQESDKVIYRPKTLADGFADQLPDKIIRASVISALPFLKPKTS